MENSRLLSTCRRQPASLLLPVLSHAAAVVRIGWRKILCGRDLWGAGRRPGQDIHPENISYTGNSILLYHRGIDVKQDQKDSQMLFMQVRTVSVCFKLFWFSVIIILHFRCVCKCCLILWNIKVKPWILKSDSDERMLRDKIVVSEAIRGTSLTHIDDCHVLVVQTSKKNRNDQQYKRSI